MNSCAWKAGPVEIKDCLPSCCRLATITLVSFVIDKNPDEYRIVPVYHCSGCKMLFKDISQKMLDFLDKNLSFGSGKLYTGKNNNAAPKIDPNSIEGIKQRVMSFTLD